VNRAAKRAVTRVLLALLVLSLGLLLALKGPEEQPTGPASAAEPAEATAHAAPSATSASPEGANLGEAPADGAAAEPGPSHDDNVAPPTCTFDDLSAPHSGYDEWDRTVLDTVFALGPDYVPPDLVAAADAFDGRPGGADFVVRALLVDDLAALLSAAHEAGVDLAIQSAYRSFSYQESTFQYWVDRSGRQEALATSARAGHSEHQLGTALDFRSLSGPPAWELDDWAATPEGAWMAANAWRFGFVMSYPRGASGVTCYDYEPWHYRYLGRELAAEVEASGSTPRELLWAAHVAKRSE